MPETDPIQASQVEQKLSQADVLDLVKAVSLQLGKTISEAQFKTFCEILLGQETAMSYWESVESDPVRSKALARMLEFSQEGRARVILQGSSGVGKTSLLQNLHQTYRLVERGSFVMNLGDSPEALELELEAHEKEFSALLDQLDASEAESSQRQAVITELRQTADAELAALAEVVAAL